jgi:hypothetical protein
LNFKLLYRGTRDGFIFIVFHKKCHNLGSNIFMIISEYEKTFGGYAHPSWLNKINFIKVKGKSFIFQM